MRSPSASLACLLAGLSLLGCEVERTNTTRRGIQLKPIAGSAAPLSAPTLPAGPLASPADPSATFSAQGQIEVLPLGQVPYDGLTPPLVSPDGRWLVTQIGTPLGDELLLGRPGAAAPADVSLAIFDLSTRPRSLAATVTEPGLVLGRWSGAEGFLVEAPRADGTRRVGLVPWTAPQPRWLLGDARHYAHAVVLPDGAVAASLFDAEHPRARLVVRTPEAQEAVLADEKLDLLFPIGAGSASHLGVVGADAAGEVVLVTVARTEAGTLEATGRVRLSGNGAAGAYQAVAGLAPMAVVTRGPLATAVLVVSEQQGGVLVVDARDATLLTRFAGGSAAAWIAAPPTGGDSVQAAVAWVTPTGLLLSSAQPGAAQFIPGARTLIEGPSLPRSLAQPGSLIALLPAASPTAPALRLARVRLVNGGTPVENVP